MNPWYIVGVILINLLAVWLQFIEVDPNLTLITLNSMCAGWMAGILQGELT